jgi:hypothetical protein
VIRRDEAAYCFRDGRGWSRDRGYRFLRDVFRAARAALREGWGDNKRYMVTRDVTIKALVRVAGDIAIVWGNDFEVGEPMTDFLQEKLQPWSALLREFRREGFYERFPARGQVERVEKIRKRLVREAEIRE